MVVESGGSSGGGYQKVVVVGRSGSEEGRRNVVAIGVETFIGDCGSSSGSGKRIRGTADKRKRG